MCPKADWRKSLLGTYSVKAKAFHSIYFEVLGEQGVVGFALFALILATLLLNLRFAITSTRHDPSLAWIAELAKALLLSLIVLAGTLVGAVAVDLVVPTEGATVNLFLLAGIALTFASVGLAVVRRSGIRA